MAICRICEVNNWHSKAVAVCLELDVFVCARHAKMCDYDGHGSKPIGGEVELCTVCVMKTGVKGADVHAMKEAIERNDEAAIAEISRRGVLRDGSVETREAHIRECHAPRAKAARSFNPFGLLCEKRGPMVEWGNPRKK